MSLNYLQKNIDITNLSGFKTKASTKYFFELKKEEDLNKIKEIKNFADKNDLKILFVGGGTNILFAFENYNGIIIKNSLKGWEFDEKNKILKTYSGEIISKIAVYLQKNHNCSVWEKFIGLPGTVGGAIFGNAGCFGLEIENNFLEAKVINLSNYSITKLQKNEILFSYRNSIFKKTGNYFLINVKFNLCKQEKKDINKIDMVSLRKQQPKGKTCGSFFKNPNKEFPAGKLIENVGLKGYKKGGAYFSDIHANFLMSDGTAKFKDLLDLINLAQKKVKEEYSIELESEVRIIFN